jgi:hypothetical protein
MQFTLTNCSNVQHKNVSFPSTLTGHTLVMKITNSTVQNHTEPLIFVQIFRKSNLAMNPEYLVAISLSVVTSWLNTNVIHR